MKLAQMVACGGDLFGLDASGQAWRWVRGSNSWERGEWVKFPNPIASGDAGE
ncbi:MAG TPA: hypothetical protein VFA43_10695 [Gemmatimonadaceae bacterium]|nr:hypothetical protein [Gemmatimonadaceae bacterium]